MDKWDRTSPVGSFPALKSGLHDMCGNVWEWIEDSYEFDAYKKHSRDNPLITKTVTDRVIRSCGWSDDQEDCRVSYRDKIPLDCPVCSRRNDIGFRVVREK
jgi:sulfatase modifying factor 1